MRSQFLSPSAILLLTLATFPAVITTLRINKAPPVGLYPSLPFQTPRYPQSQNGRRLFTRIRDGIIEYIWGLSSTKDGHSSPLSFSSSPPSFLAQYGGDVVLRFQISNAEEAKALAEAADVLFLDVWEFTTEWVDIRLAKDVVGAYTAHNAAFRMHDKC